MKFISLFVLVLFASGISSCDIAQQSAITYSSIPVSYPITKQENIVEEYFGVEVDDPYRWLENANLAETKNWIETQNKSTFSYLENIPFRDKVESRLSELLNYERYFVCT
jgi:prolyl oligopeptidase